MSEGVPEGWAWTTLEQVAVLGSGGTPRSRDPRYYDGNIPWAVIGDLTDGPVGTTAARITEMGLANSSAKIVPAGAVLVAMYGSIGKLGITTAPLATNQAIAFALPRSGIVTARYLFWYLLSQRSALDAAGKGAAQRNISQTILRSWPVPLPPLPEQRRIVAALDEQLSRLDAAECLLKAASVRTGLLHKSILEAVVWPNPLPDTWTLGTIGDLLERIEAGRSFACQPRRAKLDEWGILKVSAMTWGEFNQDENKAVLSDGQIDKRFEVRSGDVLVSRANTQEYVGAPVLVGETRPMLLLSDKSLRLVPRQGVEPAWLTFILSSPTVRATISEQATGMKDSMRNISQKSLASVPAPVVPSSAQPLLAEGISSSLVTARRLDRRLSAAHSRAVALRKSLLSAAFGGKLVSQDPSDEPASVLLERILEERNAPASKSSSRPKKSPAPAQAPRLAPSATQAVPAGIQEELPL